MIHLHNDTLPFRYSYYLSYLKANWPTKMASVAGWRRSAEEMRDWSNRTARQRTACPHQLVSVERAARGMIKFTYNCKISGKIRCVVYCCVVN